MHGGSQERNRRGGTESLPHSAGFTEASRLAIEGIESNGEHMRRLGSMLRDLLGRIDGVRFVTPPVDALPNIVNITFEDAASSIRRPTGVTAANMQWRAIGCPTAADSRLGWATRFGPAPSRLKDQT